MPFTEAVVCDSGYTFEKEAILQHWATRQDRRECPVTRVPVSERLIPNRAIMDIINGRTACVYRLVDRKNHLDDMIDSASFGMAHTTDHCILECFLIQEALQSLDAEDVARGLRAIMAVLQGAHSDQYIEQMNSMEVWWSMEVKFKLDGPWSRATACVLVLLSSGRAARFREAPFLAKVASGLLTDEVHDTQTSIVVSDALLLRSMWVMASRVEGVVEILQGKVSRWLEVVVRVMERSMDEEDTVMHGCKLLRYLTSIPACTSAMLAEAKVDNLMFKVLSDHKAPVVAMRVLLSLENLSCMSTIGIVLSILRETYEEEEEEVCVVGTALLNKVISEAGSGLKQEEVLRIKLLHTLIGVLDTYKDNIDIVSSCCNALSDILVLKSHEQPKSLLDTVLLNLDLVGTLVKLVSPATLLQVKSLTAMVRLMGGLYALSQSGKDLLNREGILETMADAVYQVYEVPQDDALTDSFMDVARILVDHEDYVMVEALKVKMAWVIDGIVRFRIEDVSICKAGLYLLRFMGTTVDAKFLHLVLDRHYTDADVVVEALRITAEWWSLESEFGRLAPDLLRALQHHADNKLVMLSALQYWCIPYKNHRVCRVLHEEQLTVHLVRAMKRFHDDRAIQEDGLHLLAGVPGCTWEDGMVGGTLIEESVLAISTALTLALHEKGDVELIEVVCEAIRSMSLQTHMRDLFLRTSIPSRLLRIVVDRPGVCASDVVYTIRHFYKHNHLYGTVEQLEICVEILQGLVKDTHRVELFTCIMNRCPDGARHAIEMGVVEICIEMMQGPCDPQFHTRVTELLERMAEKYPEELVQRGVCRVVSEWLPKVEIQHRIPILCLLAHLIKCRQGLCDLSSVDTVKAIRAPLQAATSGGLRLALSWAAILKFTCVKVEVKRYVMELDAETCLSEVKVFERMEAMQGVAASVQEFFSSRGLKRARPDEEAGYENRARV